ncbi:MAG: 2Fe-2S iron-sulfur cluster binding domain-containing protein [Chitinophagales bacterium]|nr:2Fe-2S iron-sulfur cluster binding domain-containing protein [Chitinophagales bacterium]
MSKFHKLKVKEVNRETADAVSVSFEVPHELKTAFTYIPGQYTTLKLLVNGQHVNRSYSFCSSPYINEPFTIAVKRVTGGVGSNFINDNFKPGLEVEVMEPMGKFHTPLSETNSKHYVLFGGGSGITPVISILKSVLVKEPNSTVTLFYGNRNEDSVIFKERLQQLAQQYASRLKVVYIYDAPLQPQPYSGYVVKDMALRLLRENTNLNFQNAEFFICGPTPMMKEVEQALGVLGIPKEKTHIEYFTAKAEEDKQAAGVGTSSATEEPFTGVASVKIIYDGNERELKVKEKETILEAALDAGYDPPYSCMVAACCTCRAKLLEGKVAMDDRESLTDAEIAKGYVLTCQSHPKSNRIVLNYDM